MNYKNKVRIVTLAGAILVSLLFLYLELELLESKKDIIAFTLIVVFAVFFFIDLFLLKIIAKINQKLIETERLNISLEKKTEQKELELDKNLSLLSSYKRAVDKSNIVSKTNTKGIITYVNDEFCRISGYSKNELLGKPHSIIRHPDVPKEVFKELWDTIKAKKTWCGQVKNLKKNGDFYIVNTTIVPILDSEQNIDEFIAIRHDVTDLLRQKEELKEIKIDSLTGLKNKNALKDDMDRNKKSTLAILHIDNYNEIKDFYGVETSDNVIQKIALKLCDIFNQKEFEVYKLSSKQFAIAVKDKECEKRFPTDISKFIKDMINHPVIGMEYEIFIDITAGIACSEGSENLIKSADLALQEAKKRNIELYIFDAQVTVIEDYEKNILWSSKLKKAISDNRLLTFYQPIVNNKTNEYEKYEALIRMEDEEGKIISPFFFLDMAKRSRLYPYITKTIIKDSIATFKNNEREFSINITAEDTENDSTADYFEKMLLESGLADRCVIEITESEEIKDYVRVISFIKKFKKLGCKIAIDDFGSGYSNFNYLAELGADYVKIDGSLIKNIDKDETSELIVKTIVSFAKNMQMKTIAEFVSSKEIHEKVTELGIDYSQGFYFSEPKKEPLPINN